MFILRIEHPVANFDNWKEAFDKDPVDRRKSGARRYRIMRPIDNINYVIIDLEFDTAKQAEAMLEALRPIWGQVQGKIITKPFARIINIIESVEY